MKPGIHAVLLIALTAPGIMAQEPAGSRRDVEAIVHDYILRHPEVLVESVRLYQDRQRAEHLDRAKGEIRNHRAELMDDKASPVAGNTERGVPVVAFFDYRCGYCRRSAAALLKLAGENSKARIVFKELPILGPESSLAAGAALAAHKQGAYLAFHRALMEADEPITPQWVNRLASKLGLDVTRLQADMRSDETRASLLRNQQLADAIGVKATPSFVIGSELVSGIVDPNALEALIEKARSRM